MTPMTEIEKIKDGVYEKVMSRRFAEVLKEALAEDQVRAGEQKRQSGDLIFILLLESVLAARECMKYNRIKTQQEKKDLMQDSPPRQTLERSLAVLVRYEP